MIPGKPAATAGRSPMNFPGDRGFEGAHRPDGSRTGPIGAVRFTSEEGRAAGRLQREPALDLHRLEPSSGQVILGGPQVQRHPAPALLERGRDGRTGSGHKTSLSRGSTWARALAADGWRS